LKCNSPSTQYAQIRLNISYIAHFFGPEVIWRSSWLKVLNPSLSENAAMSSEFYLALKLIAGFLIMIVPIPTDLLRAPLSWIYPFRIVSFALEEASALLPKSEVTLPDLIQPRAFVP
jgi:hypothetical protein